MTDAQGEGAKGALVLEVDAVHDDGASVQRHERDEGDCVSAARRRRRMMLSRRMRGVGSG